MINGVCWAECNVDKPGVFAAIPEAYGMLYQWNRKKGWPAAGAVTGWDPSIPSGDYWEVENDPCPAGWRVPTDEEIKKLLDRSKVTSDSVSVDGIRGKTFTDNWTGNRIFLPALLYRSSNGCALENAERDSYTGFYWTGSFAFSAFARALFFSREVVSRLAHQMNFAMAIRCVADWKCDTVFTDTTESICVKDLPYIWEDTVFPEGTETGTYYFQHISSVNGCDSIVRLHLTVHQTFYSTLTDTVCSGSDYNHSGFHLPAVYADTIVRDTSGNSIRILSLAVYPSYTLSLFDTICPGELYTLYGFDVSEPGVHVLSLKTIHGCDSIVTLELAEEKGVCGDIVFFLEDCETHRYVFSFEPDSVRGNWQWDMGDGITYRTQAGYHAYADSGTYRVSLRLETLNGCGNEYAHEQRVPHYAREVVIRANRTVIDTEMPAVWFRAEVPAGTVCRWEFGDGKTAEGVEVKHSYDATSARYYDVVLRVFNADSCVTEGTMRIEVLPLPKEVNTFSPNGDGVNDVFMPGFRVEIVNRNGLRIYGGDNGWDGTCRTGNAPEDTYFYKLYYRTVNGDRVKTGHVTLIR